MHMEQAYQPLHARALLPSGQQQQQQQLNW
jgi:hypothetical protein